MQQDVAFNILKMGGNVFLTGAAGSGKTYLLNKYINYLKENNVAVAVTASTGIAATHLHGTTIHSWAGIGINESITNKEIEKLLTINRIKRNYKNTKVLIIDEISMLHKHQLDMVDTIARFALDSKQPFGGMQVILCGDFFQLPPIASKNSPTEEKYAFEGRAWQEGNFKVCYLSEQHRQDKDELLIVLNDIRCGTAGEHTKNLLRSRYKKEPIGNTRATKLYSRNVNVDLINARELDNIRGDTKTFIMESSGWQPLVEGLKKSCLAYQNLYLKIGAEVMFIKNSNIGLYYNGTRGVVIAFDSKGWPIVKTYKNDIITVHPEEWSYEEYGIVKATIAQIPLRLAWAITIHKSQGMTLDAAEIDLGDAFEPGMGYVALSRVRSLSGLTLINLNDMALKIHPKILIYDNSLRRLSSNALSGFQSLDAKEIQERQKQTLTMRFSSAMAKKTGGSKLKKQAVGKPVATPTHVITLQMIKDNLPIDEIAKKRGLALSTIVSHVEKLHGLKEIDKSYLQDLKNRLLKADFEAIFAELTKSEDGKLSNIYNKLEGRHSYTTIQIVRLFLA